MRRSHKIIFFLIALLAFGTFLFGLLQFVNLREEKLPAGSNTKVPATNS